MTNELDQIIQLGSNENPLGTSPRAAAAIQNAVGNLNRYPYNLDTDLRQALASYIGRGLTAENITTANGGCDILDLVAQTFLKPRDEVIIQTPTFPVYQLTAARCGAKVVQVPLTADFTLDVPATLAAVTERTKIVYTCSPNNPTGSYISAAAMQALLDGLPEDVVVLADEVYYHFATAADHTNTLQHVLAGRNVLILHSFSKVFGLAGLRLGYLIGRADLVQQVDKSRLPFHLNTLTLAGAMAALSDRDYIEESIETVHSGREQLYHGLKQLGVDVWPTQANFLLFKTSGDAKALAETLQQKGVTIRELTNFYMPDYLRVSVGRAAENARFLHAIAESLG